MGKESLPKRPFISGIETVKARTAAPARFFAMLKKSPRKDRPEAKKKKGAEKRGEQKRVRKEGE
jgi:hypothetical protein